MEENVKVTDLDFAQEILKTLQNASQVFDQIAKGTMEPGTIQLARECQRHVVCESLDNVLGMVSGMKGGMYEANPNGMLDMLQSELSDAIEQIKFDDKDKKSTNINLN